MSNSLTTDWVVYDDSGFVHAICANKLLAMALQHATQYGFAQFEHGLHQVGDTITIPQVD